MKKGRHQEEQGPCFVFVGEKPSRRAFGSGASWQNGRLAAKTLHDALRACGIEPAEQQYINLFGDDPDAPPVANAISLRRIRQAEARGYQVVALGQKVTRELSKHSIIHLRLIHPAARGSIRKKSRYHAHVAAQLTPTISHPAKGECSVMLVDDGRSIRKAA